MKRLPCILIAALLVLGFAGCQAAYDTLRLKQDMDCQHRMGADRDDCMRRDSMSYDEYQRQLKKQEQNTEK